MRLRRMIVCCLLLGCISLRAPAGEDRWSVSLFGTLTTASKLFPNPNARDEFRRGEFSPINASFSVGYKWINGELIEIHRIETPVGIVTQHKATDPSYGSKWISGYIYLQAITGRWISCDSP